MLQTQWCNSNSTVSMHTNLLMHIVKRNHTPGSAVNTGGCSNLKGSLKAAHAHAHTAHTSWTCTCTYTNCTYTYCTCTYIYTYCTYTYCMHTYCTYIMHMLMNYAHIWRCSCQLTTSNTSQTCSARDDTPSPSRLSLNPGALVEQAALPVALPFLCLMPPTSAGCRICSRGFLRHIPAPNSSSGVQFLPCTMHHNTFGQQCALPVALHLPGLMLASVPEASGDELPPAIAALGICSCPTEAPKSNSPNSIRQKSVLNQANVPIACQCSC